MAQKSEHLKTQKTNNIFRHIKKRFLAIYGGIMETWDS
jgi:hypothetical protein